MKNQIQVWIVALLLVLFVLPAGAATVDVTARGKNEAVAQTNAGVSAVRQTMQGLVTKTFLRTNRERVRKDVILQSGHFVRAVSVHNQQRQDGFVVLSASVEVDERALAGVLAGMTLDETSRQQLCAALADPQGAIATQPADTSGLARAPSAVSKSAADSVNATTQLEAPTPPQTCAEAAPQAASARDSVAQFQDTAGKAKAANTPGAAGRETGHAPSGHTGTGHAPADALTDAFQEVGRLRAASDTGGILVETDVILEDTRALLPRLVPSALLSVFLEAEGRTLASALLAMDIRELRLHCAVDEDLLDFTLLLVPLHPARMQAALVEGNTVEHVVGALGLAASDFPQHARPYLQARLERVTGSPMNLLRIQGTSLFLGGTGKHTIVGILRSSVAQAAMQVQKGVVPFAVEGKAPLRYCQRYTLSLEDPEQPAQDAAEDLVLSTTAEMTPVPGGWIARGHYDLGGFWPELAQAGSLDLSKLFVYGKEPPFLLLGWANGKHLTALLDMLDEGEPDIAVFRVLLEKLDSALLSLGGNRFTVPPLRLPAVALTLRGDPAALQSLMALGQFDMAGQNVSVSGWDKVTLHALDDSAGVPLELVLAQRGATLLGGLMDVQALAQPRQSARAVLTAALKGSGLTLPEAVSYVALFDIRQFWQELRTLTDDVFIASLLEMEDPQLRLALRQLFDTTPPITCCTGWQDSPDMTRGTAYIAITDADTTPFYQALKNLIDLANQRKSSTPPPAESRQDDRVQ